MESNLNLIRALDQDKHKLSGQLYKYTNVVKGWQYRWFTVNVKDGTLSYYLCDSVNTNEDPSYLTGCTPRGKVHLAGAVVCPSDEDSRTFSISCASSDTIKLRATDARERQEWVNGLRSIIESHTKAMNINNTSTLPPREQLAASDAFVAAREQLHQTELCNARLAKAIENVQSPLSPTDPDFLTLKAYSIASVQCLNQCFSLLQNLPGAHTERKDNPPDMPL